MNDRPGLLLALNTAEGVLQLVLGVSPEQEAASPAPRRRQRARPCGILCAQEWRLPSQGAELLTPLLRDSCARIGAEIQDIRRIACVSGPGSFTGLRLALASAAGLARATGAEQAGLPYLPLLAENAASLLGPIPAPKMRPVLWAITHARQNLVHVQAFEPIPSAENPPCPQVTALTESAVATVEEAARVITALHDATPALPVLFGSGAARNAALLSGLLKTPLFLGPHASAPTADTLFRAAQGAAYSAQDIPPVYARPCDAEENLDHIAGLLHLDSSEARRALGAKTRAAPAPDSVYTAPCPAGAERG